MEIPDPHTGQLKFIPFAVQYWSSPFQPEPIYRIIHREVNVVAIGSSPEVSRVTTWRQVWRERDRYVLGIDLTPPRDEIHVAEWLDCPDWVRTHLLLCALQEQQVGLADLGMSANAFELRPGNEPRGSLVPKEPTRPRDRKPREPQL